MLDYFMVPFAAPGDKEVLSAMAQRINLNNTGADTDAIKQAPHHFEIWQLGQIEENGRLTPKLDFLADCSSLVRGGIREGDDRAPGTDRPENPTAEPRRGATGA